MNKFKNRLISYLRFCLSSDSKTEPKSTSSINKQTRDANQAHLTTNMQ